jgi:hypothetical protein
MVKYKASDICYFCVHIARKDVKECKEERYKNRLT